MSFLDYALNQRPSCELSCVAGSTAQTLTTSWANLNLWTSIDTLSLVTFTASTLTGQMLVQTGGLYQLACDVHATISAPVTSVSFAFADNGVYLPSSVRAVLPTNSGTVVDKTFSWLVYCLPGDVLTVQVTASAGTNLTLVSGGFLAVHL
jgi:hypothetical protein